MSVTFGPATPADTPHLRALLAECHRHYYGTDEGADRAAEALLSGGSSCEAWLARDGATALGFASFAVLHTGPQGRGTLYLKDLFISDTARSGGLGARFLRALAREAVARDCVRFDWTAEAGNPRAVALYDRIGAERVTEKIYFRLTGAALDDMAGAPEPEG